jgi:polyisoprenoid-binding protein YceI
MTGPIEGGASGMRLVGIRRFAALVLAGAVVCVVVGGGFGLWYLFLRPAGPAAVGDPSLAPLPSAAAVASSTPLASGGLDGTWNVDTSIGSPSDWSDSFVGYRVQETLGSIGANTAVGRTPRVSGSLTLRGSTVTEATVTADLTGLRSDDDRRDSQLRRQGIQTGQFPTAEFTLTKPIELGSVPTEGTEVTATANGTLSLHGVTRDVAVPLTATLSGGTIVLQGSLPIDFADYAIEKPTSFAVLSIEDHGTMELQLFFTHS